MIVIISGYARSGKSTAADYFRSKGWVVFSTSQLMHELARDLFRIFNLEVDTTQKGALLHACVSQEAMASNESEGFVGTSSSAVMTTRDFMSGFAEGVIKRHLTRDCLISALIPKIHEVCEDRDVIIEVYNPEEYHSLSGYWLEVDRVLSIRSHRERADADNRTLILGATQIWNDGDFEEFFDKLDAAVA